MYYYHRTYIAMDDNNNNNNNMLQCAFGRQPRQFLFSNGSFGIFIFRGWTFVLCAAEIIVLIAQFLNRSQYHNINRHTYTNIIERQRILLYFIQYFFASICHTTLRHIIAYLIRSYCTVVMYTHRQYDPLLHCVFHKTRTSREMSHIHTTIFVWCLNSEAI